MNRLSIILFLACIFACSTVQAQRVIKLQQETTLTLPAKPLITGAFFNRRTDRRLSLQAGRRFNRRRYLPMAAPPVAKQTIPQPKCKNGACEI